MKVVKMKYETTPEKITNQILDLCNSISMHSHPSYIPVKVYPFSIKNECFYNVKQIVETNGGKIVYGWAIWQWANILIEAEAHAIWQNKENELIDITPHSYNENKILFLKDENLNYDGNVIPNVRKPLTESPLVKELISLFDIRDNEMARDKYSPICYVSKNIVDRIQEILSIIKRPVGRNEMCSCGSGIKYKKCCGKFE